MFSGIHSKSLPLSWLSHWLDPVPLSLMILWSCSAILLFILSWNNFTMNSKTASRAIRMQATSCRGTMLVQQQWWWVGGGNSWLQGWAVTEGLRVGPATLYSLLLPVCTEGFKMQGLQLGAWGLRNQFSTVPILSYYQPWCDIADIASIKPWSFLSGPYCCTCAFHIKPWSPHMCNCIWGCLTAILSYASCAAL